MEVGSETYLSIKRSIAAMLMQLPENLTVLNERFFRSLPISWRTKQIDTMTAGRKI
jgi:hypothetical protein